MSFTSCLSWLSVHIFYTPMRIHKSTAQTDLEGVTRAPIMSNEAKQMPTYVGRAFTDIAS